MAEKTACSYFLLQEKVSILKKTGAQLLLCACFLACWSENVGSVVPC